MSIKYTNHFLSKLEELLGETEYMLRYEKGNFKSGYCLLKEQKVIVVNKYFPLEGRINSLIDIIRTMDLPEQGLSEKSRKLYEALKQPANTQQLPLFDPQ